MSTPDFNRYTLALFKDGRELESSGESGLRPLVHLLKAHMGAVTGCELHDKVVGLASAKLIAASGIVVEVKAGTMSKEAISFLGGTDIEFNFLRVVDMILNRDGSAQCPMERKAKEIRGPEEFLEHMMALTSPEGRKP